jgi:hypothetical protein
MEVRIILFVIIGYMIYKFATRFLMPIMKITKMTHGHMNEMRKKMENMEQQHQNQRSKRVDGDYIDYEEVK